MKILSMTATFGKLENQTLTLQPGLNVIHAPNEWGKSTWCAFLADMLYGLETRTKSTKTALADKERYAPWSGSPMSGRLELEWNGRNITIERWTKGRTPMGEFRAYETESGMDVVALTAQDCGRQLLGVERSVFIRCGFLRLTDLPVTEDDALRRRLNALVTTGDESESADVLAQKLRDLKNKIRYNRSGLLPAAEKEAGELEDTLAQIRGLERQIDDLTLRQRQLQAEILALENHETALEYAEAQENRRLIAQAELRREEAKNRLDTLETPCADLPPQEKCRLWKQRLDTLHRQTVELDMVTLPPVPQRPLVQDVPDPQQASSDADEYRRLRQKAENGGKIGKIALCAAVVCVIGLILSLVVRNGLLAALTGALLSGCAVAVGYFADKKGKIARQTERLAEKYGSEEAAQWVENARAAQEELHSYAQAVAQREQATAALWEKREALNTQIRELTGGEPISQCLEKWDGALRQWEELTQARQSYESAKSHAEAVSAMAKSAEKPKTEDTLTYPKAQTELLLAQAKRQMQQLGQQLGQLQGRKDAMGQEIPLQQRLEAVQGRIQKLILTYDALDLAQATLAEAAGQLQRRFAPKIAKQAQEIFAALTDGRYDRLTISQDLSLQAGAEGEDVLRSTLWRSEGTVDQMYLALRLAVSAVLTPDAPMILDDALVRFDDVRHRRAMELLEAEGKKRQILLFSCQNR